MSDSVVSIGHTDSVFGVFAVMMLVAALSLVGCGSSDQPAAGGTGTDATGSPDADAGVAAAADPASSANTGGTAGPAPAARAGVAPAADSDAGPTAGPAIDGGMQLPSDTDVPAAQAQPAEPGGPVQPGEGGIELPDGQSSNGDADGNSGTELKYASWEAIERHAKATGTITVVDLWSTVCAPCVKEFPELVRLSKEMPDTVTCIGVSVDYDGRKSKPPESYQEAVSGFLKAVGADFDNYLCNTPSDDVYSEVDLPSIPAVLIFDAKGNLVKRFVDAGETIGFSYEKDIIPFIEGLAG